MALLVQTFLFMNRSDLAQKQFATMQQKEDDHTLTLIASAWVNLSKVFSTHPAMLSAG